ncbi:MAG: signal peptidase I [Sphingomonadales bacterium]|nr:signal peptidase I [Sphingomonadales bacterium]PIX67134.1 MAG: signal peptidase I [Sphingomonadales bacterium CG_4_10_14_3_um_filter_58_15]NCO49925.1 signal peptidase I [Sphingomonadales bacterium]NCP00922.1 signal peptidase I [Sphingomonadales bacterium]NCP28020.1 signal peptidase I [Sphingomonadales bacterium]
MDQETRDTNMALENTADSKSSEKPDKEKTDWIGEIKSIGLLLLAVLAFHSLVAKPFYIPSVSMMPGLLVGDRLIVSKYAYGWSWVSPTFHIVPRVSGRLFGSLPERGDVVILTPRDQSSDYIKRVIGLPGDTIELRGGQVFLNGIGVRQDVQPDLQVPVDANNPCNANEFPGARGVDADGKPVCNLPIVRETLPNGVSYNIIDLGPQYTDDVAPVEIPEGEVYLLGDNRDLSADSRVASPLGLGGPIPWENIGGRAEFITFSLDGTTTLNPLTWWGAFRSGRAGLSLRPDKAEAAAE